MYNSVFYSFKQGQARCPCCDNLDNTQILQFYDNGVRSLQRCNNCGFLFLFPKIPIEQIKELENKSSWKEMETPFEVISKLSGVASFIEEFTPYKGSCLEIGCGNGYLLKALQIKGWEVLGVEISDTAVNNAKSLGINVIQGTIEELDLPIQSFDIIILWHVLEHIYTPKFFLSKTKGLIKKTGLLFIQVPDFDQLSSYIRDKRERDILCTVHVNYFTILSLTELLRRSGWFIRSHFHDSDNYFITCVAEPHK